MAWDIVLYVHKKKLELYRVDHPRSSKLLGRFNGDRGGFWAVIALDIGNHVNPDYLLLLWAKGTWGRASAATPTDW